MTTPIDFRIKPLSLNAIIECGRYSGRFSYWRLYVIENVIRLIIHSILTAQISPEWLSFALSSKKAKGIKDRKADYQSQPDRANPGNHDIYYLYLGDLTKIINEHAGLFDRYISDIDTWITRLESIRLPRNIIGHMNWPNNKDRADMDRLYRDIKRLEQQLQKHGLRLIIP